MRAASPGGSNPPASLSGDLCCCCIVLILQVRTIGRREGVGQLLLKPNGIPSNCCRHYGITRAMSISVSMVRRNEEPELKPELTTYWYFSSVGSSSHTSMKMR